MLRPLSNFLIVSEIEAAEKIGSIYRPSNAGPDPVIRARVLSVGPGLVSETGTRLPMSVNPGETVVFLKRRGQKQEYQGEKIILVPETDVLAVEEERETCACV